MNTETTAPQLFVTNSPAYVWRGHSRGMGADMNDAPCWYVVDSERNIYDGGYYSGGNTESGYANHERKKDALAYAQGFAWAMKNLSKLSKKANTRNNIVTGWEEECPHGKNTADDREYHEYRQGVYDAWEKSINNQRLHTGKILEGEPRLYKVK